MSSLSFLASSFLKDELISPTLSGGTVLFTLLFGSGIRGEIAAIIYGKLIESESWRKRRAEAGALRSASLLRKRSRSISTTRL